MRIFFQTVTEIKAGKPYIIKWADGTAGSYIEDPTFYISYIERMDLDEVTSKDGKFTFIGTYDPVSIGSSGDNTILYMGSDNKLYYPNASMNIYAFRAYFQLDGITAADLSTTNAIQMFFGDGETTGVVPIDNGQWIMDNDAWYKLDERLVTIGSIRGKNSATLREKQETRTKFKIIIKQI